MRFLVMIVGLWACLAGAVQAQCAGRDLRPALSAPQKQMVQAHLAATPYATGNHWKAVRGSQVLHLIGTIHLADDRLPPSVARLKPLIEGADRLLLEMTDAEEAQLMASMGTNPEFLVLQDTTLVELLGDDWPQLAQALSDRGIPPAMGSKMQPWYLSMLLSLPSCMKSLLVDDNGLDTQLERIADQAGVPTQALEPFDTGFRAFADVPMDLQMVMIRSALGDDQVQEDLFETMVNAYFEEAHVESVFVMQMLTPEMTSLSQQEADRIDTVIQTALLDDRNRAWIPVIEAVMAQAKGPVVAAFGAGHLGGEAGVLNLLKARGFTLTRSEF
jgi:uncharacterized protein YbaP (TraB family)